MGGPSKPCPALVVPELCYIPFFAHTRACAQDIEGHTFYANELNELNLF